MSKTIVEAAAAAAAAGLSPPDHLGAAIVAGSAVGLVAILGTASTWLRDRSTRRWTANYAAYLHASPNVDPGVVEAELHAKSDDPHVLELVLENARMIAEALTDSAVPVLGRLTREYVSNDRHADAFFRGMRRLLTDLSEDEFKALGDLMVRASSVTLPGEQPSDVELMVFKFTEDHEPQLYAVRRTIVGAPNDGGSNVAGVWQSKEGEQQQRLPLGRFEFALRLFNLLKTNGLGTVGIGKWGVSPSSQLLMSFEDVRRICSLMGP